MTDRYYIGWVRDEHGAVLSRPRKDIANAITSMVGGGHTGEDGLGNTTPYIVYCFE